MNFGEPELFTDPFPVALFDPAVIHTEKLDLLPDPGRTLDPNTTYRVRVPLQREEEPLNRADGRIPASC